MGDTNNIVPDGAPPSKPQAGPTAETQAGPETQAGAETPEAELLSQLRKLGEAAGDIVGVTTAASVREAEAESYAEAEAAEADSYAEAEAAQLATVAEPAPADAIVRIDAPEIAGSPNSAGSPDKANSSSGGGTERTNADNRRFLAKPERNPGSASRGGSRRLPAAIAAAVVVLALISAGVLLGEDRDQRLPLATQSQENQQGQENQQNQESEGTLAGINHQWQELRECESGGTYDMASGNGFFGAYQFTPETWATVGGNGNPAHAPAYEQDARAAELFIQRGSRPWPICGSGLDRPMINPIVTSWMGQDPTSLNPPSGGDLLVFFEPNASETAIADVNGALEALDWVDPEQLEFVDKEAAFGEFQMLFAQDSSITDGVRVSDMPASLRVKSSPASRLATRQDPNDPELKAIAEMPGVFEIVSGHVLGTEPDPNLTLRVDRLGIVQPLGPLVDIDSLGSQIALISLTGWSQQLVDRAPSPLGALPVLPALDGPMVLASAQRNWKLAELRLGDRIEVSNARLVRSGMTVTTTVRAQVSSEAESRHIDDLEDPTELDAGNLVLIAPDPEDPLRRIVVGTRPVEDD